MFNYYSNNNNPFLQNNNSSNPFLSSNNNIFNQNSNNIFNNNNSNNIFNNGNNYNNYDNNIFLYNFQLNNTNVSVSLETNNSIGQVPIMPINYPNSIKKFPDSTRINGKEYDFVYAENLVFDSNYKNFCPDELKMAELQSKGMPYINAWKNTFSFSNINNRSLYINNQSNNFLINNNNNSNNPFFNNNLNSNNNNSNNPFNNNIFQNNNNNNSNSNPFLNNNLQNNNNISNPFNNINSNPFLNNNQQNNNINSNPFLNTNLQNNTNSNPFSNINLQNNNNNNSNPFLNTNLQNNNNIFNNGSLQNNNSNSNNIISNNNFQNNNNNNNNIFNNFSSNNNIFSNNNFGINNNNNNSNNNFINNNNSNNIFLNNTFSNNNNNNIFNNINNNCLNQNNNQNQNIVIPGFLNNIAINNVFEKSLDEKFKDPVWLKQNAKKYEPPDFIAQVDDIAKLNLEMRKMQYLSERESQRKESKNILYDLSFDKIVLPSDETVENFYKSKKIDDIRKEKPNYKIENNYNSNKNNVWDPIASFLKRSGGRNNETKNGNINEYGNLQNINTNSKENNISGGYNNNCDLYNNVYSITFNESENKIQEDTNLFNNEFIINNNKTSNIISDNSKFVNFYRPQNINNDFEINIKLIYLGEYELIKNKNFNLHKFPTNFDNQNKEYYIPLDLILKTIIEKISEIENISDKIILPTLNDITIVTNARTFSKTTNQEKIYLKNFEKSDDNSYLIKYTFPLKKYPLIDPNYKIKPNIDEILKGDVSHVKNFEISNEFGKVVFHDDIDLSGPIKINDIILIKNEEVDLNHPRVNKLRSTVFLKFEIEDEYMQGQFLENVKEFLKNNNGNFIKFENNVLIYGVNDPNQ